MPCLWIGHDDGDLGGRERREREREPSAAAAAGEAIRHEEDFRRCMHGCSDVGQKKNCDA